MDRRTVWAILLMMIIAIAPAIFLKKPAPRGPGQRGSGADTARDTTTAPGAGASRRQDTSSARGAPPAPGAPAASQQPRDSASGREDTIEVASPLYQYGISTRGGRFIQATLPRYRSMAAADHGQPAQILPPDSKLLGLTVVRGRDTIPFGDWPFSVSAESLEVSRPTPLRLSASRNGVQLDLTYLFHPDDYRIDVDGRVSEVGPDGGLLLVGLGPTLNNTEADTNENHRALAIVTKHGETERLDLARLAPGEPKTVSGPLEWAAMKSK